MFKEFFVFCMLSIFVIIFQFQFRANRLSVKWGLTYGLLGLINLAPLLFIIGDRWMINTYGVGLFNNSSVFIDITFLLVLIQLVIYITLITLDCIKEKRNTNQNIQSASIE